MKTELPIDSHIPKILETLKANSHVVISAAPGTGKTTRLPPACLNIFSKKVLVLEPRRLAAVGAATRIASENGWSAGREVGWQIRFDAQYTDQTRLLFMTEAMLLRRLQKDADFKDVDAVILDEFHERSSYTDLTLGLLHEMQQLGHPLKLILMSATLSTDKISEYFGGAPILELPGKPYPLDIQYQKQPQRLRTDPEFYERVVQTIAEGTRQSKKDTLVFLPGVGEILRTKETLERRAFGDFEIQVLHGSLTIEEQARVLKPSARRRIILSTNIAESSVTIDGVDLVVDSGIAKRNSFDLRTGFSKLELARISKQSAQQRAGRAARTAPGICKRMWSAMDEHSMPVSELAEIHRVDLSEHVLILAQQGVTDFNQFSWFEKPPDKNLQFARNFLVSAGALEADGRISDHGRKLLEVPLAPRLAALLAEGAGAKLADGTSGTEIAAFLCALLQEKDYLSSSDLESAAAHKVECDLLYRYFLKNRASQNVQRAARQLARMAEGLGTLGTAADDLETFSRRILSRVFADRLCRRRGKSTRGVMVGGRGVVLSDTSAVRDSEFFLVLDAQDAEGGTESRVRYACGVTKEFVLQIFTSEIELRKEIKLDETSESVYLSQCRYFRDLALDEPSLSPAPPEEVQERLGEILARQLDRVLKENEALARWWGRWNFLLRARTDLESFDETALTRIFSMAAMGERSLKAVMQKDLVYFFESELAPDVKQSLAREVPATLTVPSGSRLAIQYPEAQEPFLEVRLQEVFGWTETPKILGGTVPVTLHLLGPNYRPVQITKDLSSFWKNGYPEVKKEMRARYPRHSWPDDPTTAPAVAKGRPRR